MQQITEAVLKDFVRGVADGPAGPDDDVENWTIPEQPAKTLLDDLRAFMLARGVYVTRAPSDAAGGLLAEAGDSMTDQAFLAYCEGMTATPRCGFVPAHMARLCRLAGDDERAERYDRELAPIVDRQHHLVIELISAARDRMMPGLDQTAVA